ncbi:DUF4326 domain-containing protein [Acidithiobacillus thiooxidans]|uniref:DUF4326 domain-containing protein n=1 Tax=Acidithiobacillus thiooxidans TaxID=930 RepID=UPI001C06EEDB|nr:DUF4326 domain-containing protein [Acidithiobacillus thiooxidans]MBU2792723.1 DUF4326 domain-containing protein [Acidithiobacillus thiooxidans]
MSHSILNIQSDDCRQAAYVARPSPLGNPYAIGPDGSREEVIERYRHWLAARIAERDPVVCTALLGIQPDQPLSCHCAPLPCHATVIAEILDGGVQERCRARETPSLRYAGIGSRSTPDPVLQVMRKIAHRLSELGYTLLSGGASGADSAFQAGCTGKKEIYLPWAGFRDWQADFCIPLPSSEAFRVAEVVHPAGNRMNDRARALMARNSHQVLGADLRSPVDFVVCWTPDSCESESTRSRTTGGTGQAIALADRWGIPVINLAHGKAALGRLASWITSTH